MRYMINKDPIRPKIISPTLLVYELYNTCGLLFS